MAYSCRAGTGFRYHNAVIARITSYNVCYTKLLRDDRLQLFVNLRCMKVLDRHAALYVGGGITSESVAREEWEETEIKANTLLSIMDRL